jgi:hypothetical protein
MQDANRLADHSYPDLQQIVSDFNRPTLGDFAGFAVIVAGAGSVVVSALYFLFWILT